MSKTTFQCVVVGCKENVSTIYQPTAYCTTHFESNYPLNDNKNSYESVKVKVEDDIWKFTWERFDRLQRDRDELLIRQGNLVGRIELLERKLEGLMKTIGMGWVL